MVEKLSINNNQNNQYDFSNENTPKNFIKKIEFDENKTTSPKNNINVSKLDLNNKKTILKYWTAENFRPNSSSKEIPYRKAPNFGGLLRLEPNYNIEKMKDLQKYTQEEINFIRRKISQDKSYKGLKKNNSIYGARPFSYNTTNSFKFTHQKANSVSKMSNSNGFSINQCTKNTVETLDLY